MRRILGIIMLKVKNEKIKNKEVYKRFRNSESFEEIWRRRQLLFLGRIVRLDNNKYPPMLITAICEGKQCCGRPFRTICDTMVEGIRTIVPDVDSRDNV